MKRFYKDKKASVNCSEAKKNDASCLLVTPVMSQLSTAGFVPPSVYIGFRLFVLLERRSGDLSSMLWRVREKLVP